jgi:hypothetical protein
MNNRVHVYDYDVLDIIQGIYGDGLISLLYAFPHVWVDQLRGDIEKLDREALAIPNGVVPRGPDRHYAEIHPERLRGFLDIVTHPWFIIVCKAILGPDYRVTEVGFDIPGPGAKDQPWHRDFPSPPETRKEGRITMIKFNIIAMEGNVPGRAPLRIAPGTQWDDLGDIEDGMFPPKEMWSRYDERAELRYAKKGSMSASTALIIHGGTANVEGLVSRPTLVVAADGPEGNNHTRHDLQLTKAFAASLSEEVLRHIHHRIVDTLEPIIQVHDIEGLRMGS